MNAVKTKVQDVFQTDKCHHGNNGKLQQNQFNSQNGNGYPNQQSGYRIPGTPYSMNGGPNQNSNYNQAFAGGYPMGNQRHNQGTMNYPDTKQNQYQMGYPNQRL